MVKLSDIEQKVLNHIKKFTLTTFEAVSVLHVMNPQDCIKNINKKGYDIKKVWKTSKMRKRPYAVYYLI